MTSSILIVLGLFTVTTLYLIGWRGTLQTLATLALLYVGAVIALSL